MNIEFKYGLCVLFGANNVYINITEPFIHFFYQFGALLKYENQVGKHHMKQPREIKFYRKRLSVPSNHNDANQFYFIPKDMQLNTLFGDPVFGVPKRIFVFFQKDTWQYDGISHVPRFIISEHTSEIPMMLFPDEIFAHPNLKRGNGHLDSPSTVGNLIAYQYNQHREFKLSYEDICRFARMQTHVRIDQQQHGNPLDKLYLPSDFFNSSALHKVIYSCYEKMVDLNVDFKDSKQPEESAHLFAKPMDYSIRNNPYRLHTIHINNEYINNMIAEYFVKTMRNANIIIFTDMIMTMLNPNDAQDQERISVKINSNNSGSTMMTMSFVLDIYNPYLVLLECMMQRQRQHQKNCHLGNNCDSNETAASSAETLFFVYDPLYPHILEYNYKRLTSQTSASVNYPVLQFFNVFREGNRLHQHLKMAQPSSSSNDSISNDRIITSNDYAEESKQKHKKDCCRTERKMLCSVCEFKYPPDTSIQYKAYLLASNDRRGADVKNSFFIQCSTRNFFKLIENDTSIRSIISGLSEVSAAAAADASDATTKQDVTVVIRIVRHVVMESVFYIIKYLLSINKHDQQQQSILVVNIHGNNRQIETLSIVEPVVISSEAMRDGIISDIESTNKKHSIEKWIKERYNEGCLFIEYVRQYKTQEYPHPTTLPPTCSVST